MQPGVHYRVHNSLVPILSTINPVHALSFPTKILQALFSPVRATRPAHVILLDFIAQIISGEENKSRSSSLEFTHHFDLRSTLAAKERGLN